MRAGNPILESLLLDKGGHPVRIVIVLQHLLPVFLDSDKPRGQRLVDERGITPPAERIRMTYARLLDETTRRFQMLQNVLVRLFHVNT